jgi:hypothetical protein
MLLKEKIGEQEYYRRQVEKQEEERRQRNIELHNNIVSTIKFIIKSLITILVVCGIIYVIYEKGIIYFAALVITIIILLFLLQWIINIFYGD